MTFVLNILVNLASLDEIMIKICQDTCVIQSIQFANMHTLKPDFKIFAVSIFHFI